MIRKLTIRTVDRISATLIQDVTREQILSGGVFGGECTTLSGSAATCTQCLCRTSSIPTRPLSVKIPNSSA